MSQTKSISNFSILNLSVAQVIALHLVLLVLKLLWVTNWSLELHYEEAQYWLWSTKLDWSYYSKPGMVAWMNYLSTAIFGHTVLGIKFPALVAGFVTSLAIFFAADELFKDRKISVLASLLLYFMPFYFSVSLFHSTDSFLVAFGAVSFYYFIKALNTDAWKHWLLVGLFLGLAMLSKFTAIIIAGTYGLYLLFYERKYIPKLIVSGVVMVFCMLPFFIWNIQNDFVTFKHVSGLSGGGDKSTIPLLTYLNAFLEYVGGQVGIISPFLLLLLIKSKAKWNKKTALIVLPAIVSFSFFLLVLIKRGKAPYVNWAFFNYAPLAIFFAYALVKAKRLKWLIPIGVLMAFLFFLIANTNRLDTIGLGSVVSPKNDPTDTYHRWKDLAKGVEDKLQTGDYILYAEDYKLASALQFYLGLDHKVYYLGAGNRSNQFSFWNEIAEIDTDGKPMLFIGKHPKFPEIIASQFTSISKAEVIPIYWRGEEIRQYYIFETIANGQLKSIEKGF